MNIRRTAMLGILSCLTFAVLSPIPAHAESVETVCPETVVLAARGSDQNPADGESFEPQNYTESAEVSNGYEGPNLAALFHQVEQRHPGTMDGVYVLSLDEEEYPAKLGLPALAEEGEELLPIEMLERVAQIVQENPVGDLLFSVAEGFMESVQTGANSVPTVVENYEASTGCEPQYVVVGYSQGAVVASKAEKYLADTGRLKGSVTIGNPLYKVAWAAERPELPAAQRVEYCIPGDVVCDFSLDAAQNALSNKAKLHGSYFMNEPSAQQIQVIDAVANVLDSAD